ncbi:hypothetical protein D477_012815 [Arthrobacter crystallopoietes BAB-32]|uniref:Uncharacterized protein n=1 Tax=Arthrobacter crystallopoietes BAB-32 TaxID=1246476 RepID=N1V6J0_9MICC|nr:hypothetical protein [Arthrobacter crystallopoietes]EMY33848.1 hypothetical protein D477_012815 [Arthrobacter crystallopoietes BAB-32]
MAGYEEPVEIDLSNQLRKSECSLFRPGHQVNWIQVRRGMSEPGVAVDVHVEPWLGTVQLVVDGRAEFYWNHTVEDLVEALNRPGALPLWHPRVHLLTVKGIGSPVAALNLAPAARVESCRDTRQA